MDQWLNYEWQLFQWVQSKVHTEFLDQVMPYVTNLHHHPLLFTALMIPLGIFWIYHRRFEVVRVLSSLVLVIAVSDSLSYRVLKPFFGRPRPPQVKQMDSRLMVEPSSQSPGFPSNHAVNNFAIAATAAWYYPPYAWLFYILAGLVAFSRVYVGVHFVGDVVGGAFIGVFVFSVLKVWLFQRLKWFSPRLSRKI